MIYFLSLFQIRSPVGQTNEFGYSSSPQGQYHLEAISTDSACSEPGSWPSTPRFEFMLSADQAARLGRCSLHSRLNPNAKAFRPAVASVQLIPPPPFLVPIPISFSGGIIPPSYKHTRDQEKLHFLYGMLQHIRRKNGGAMTNELKKFMDFMKESVIDRIRRPSYPCCVAEHWELYKHYCLCNEQGQVTGVMLPTRQQSDKYLGIKNSLQRMNALLVGKDDELSMRCVAQYLSTTSSHWVRAWFYGARNEETVVWVVYTMASG